MTKINLLEQLKLFTEEVTKDLLLPVQPQENDVEPPKERAVSVFVPRLPDMSAFRTQAPFVMHEIIGHKSLLTYSQTPRGIDPGRRVPASLTTVRSTFCVYHDDEQEGSLALLNLVERIEIALQEQVVLGRQFKLDFDHKDSGIFVNFYSDTSTDFPTAPFFLADMITTWQMPPVERKVPVYGKENHRVRKPDCFDRIGSESGTDGGIGFLGIGCDSSHEQH